MQRESESAKCSARNTTHGYELTLKSRRCDVSLFLVPHLVLAKQHLVHFLLPALQLKQQAPYRRQQWNEHRHPPAVCAVRFRIFGQRDAFGERGRGEKECAKNEGRQERPERRHGGRWERREVRGLGRKQREEGAVVKILHKGDLLLIEKITEQ